MERTKPRRVFLTNDLVPGYPRFVGRDPCPAADASPASPELVDCTSSRARAPDADRRAALLLPAQHLDRLRINLRLRLGALGECRFAPFDVALLAEHLRQRV